MPVTALELVIDVVQEFGHEFEDERLRSASADTVLFDGRNGVDELCFFTIVAELQNRVAREYGVRLLLVDDRPLSTLDHPYKTVNALAAFLASRLP